MAPQRSWAEELLSLHELLKAYSRFLSPPWKAGENSLPPALRSLQPRVCHLDSCLTTCCCHPCSLQHSRPPADHQLLFQHPLSALGLETAALDAALDSSSRPLDSAALSAPPPLPSLAVGPRIALLLSGEMRTLASTLPWTKHHLLEPSPYPVDVFLHAWDDGGTERMADILRFNGVRITAMLVEKQPSVPMELSAVIDCRKANLVDSRVLILSSESLRRAHRLKRLQEHRLQLKYLWVVRMRHDMLLRHSFWPSVARMEQWSSAGLSDLSDEARGNGSWSVLRQPDFNSSSAIHHLVYPSCGGFSGLNDQFAMGSSDAMHAYCEKPRYIHRCLLWGLPAGWHPESCHLAALDTASDMVNLQVMQLPVCYAIIRPPGFRRRLETAPDGACSLKLIDTAKDCCRQICRPDSSSCQPPETLSSPSDIRMRCIPSETQRQCETRVNETQAC